MAVPSAGLSSGEVADRVRLGQVNRSPRTDVRDYALIVARNLFTGFNAMVAPAAVILFMLSDYRAAIAVSGMAIANTLLSLIQEIRAKIHLDSLCLLTETQVAVRRDGAIATIPAGEVVLDDLVVLRAGDIIVADGILVECQFAEIDESLLTGESDPIRKQVGDQVLSGSTCIAGEAIYRADRVGAASFAHATSTQARRYHVANSPMTRSINRIVRLLSYTAILLCVVHAIGWQTLGLADDQAVRRVATTITTMVPQGLVLSATLSFIVGALAMGRRGAIVQRLNAVETMAAVDVLCTDKTGTLTTNHLKVALIQPRSGVSENLVHGDLRAYASATIDHRNRNILALVAHLGPSDAIAIDQIPFKSRNRYSAMRFDRDGRPILYVLGAIEALAGRLREPLDDVSVQRLQFDGYRLLLFADGPGDVPLADLDELPEATLRPLALIALGDELRPDVARVLEALDAQGIQFKVISGDNPETVQGTVRQLNLPIGREPIITGDEMMAAANRDACVNDHGVFGRVAPDQKLAIVESLKARGRIVAMIGDGVNDVLPIKRADLGIAMGSGSAASKTVSGLVLEGDRFELLPEVLEQGRTIVRNLRRGAKLFLTKNVYSLILILAAYVGLGIPFPFVPQQVTLLNWSVIGVPALAIAMSRQPARRVGTNPFLPEVLSFAIRTGVVFGLGGVLILVHAGYLLPDDERGQRSMFLSMLILLGISTLFRALRDGEDESSKEDRGFHLLGLIAIPVYALAMYAPPLRHFFELSPLGIREWAIVAAYAAGCWGGTWCLDRLTEIRRSRR